MGKPRNTMEGVSRGLVKSGPVLRTPLMTTLLTSQSGDEKIEDPEPDTPPAAEGSTFACSTSKCAIPTQCRPNQTKERFARHEEASPWSDLGNTGSDLHNFMWRLRRSSPRRPLRGVWVVKRVVKRRVVRMGPLLTNPLDDHSRRGVRAARSACVFNRLGPSWQTTPWSAFHHPDCNLCIVLQWFLLVLPCLALGP